MITSRLRRVLVTIAVPVAALTVCAAGAPSAAARPAAKAARAPAAAMIRGGHFSPDTPGVDVYLTAFQGKTTTLWLSGVGYGDVSGYRRITPGLYAVSMRPHGAKASTPAALSWTLDAQAGAAYTACAVGMNAQLRGIVLHDDLAPAQSGTARVRVIQAASRATHTDVVASGGPALGHDVAFATSTKYTSVPAGSYLLRATAVGHASVRTSARVSLAADTVHTVVVLDAKGGGITLRALDDASGATAMPAGAVPAGGGGAAVRPSADGNGLWEVLAGLAAVLALGLAGALGRRRSRTA
jgi:uncharacterized protein DUF4397